MIVSRWVGERIREVTGQERESRGGVRSWEIFPWPPIRRTRGVDIVLVSSRRGCLGRGVHGCQGAEGFKSRIEDTGRLRSAEVPVL